MPRYDLICEACGHKFEVVRTIHEPNPKQCPQCGKKKVRRDWSHPPAFHARYSPMHPRRNRGRGY